MENQIITKVSYSKRSYGQIGFESLVLRIVKTFVGSVIPKTRVGVSIMFLIR